VACLILGATPRALADDENYTVTIRDHRFAPEEIAIPAGRKISLIIKNLDSAASEFEIADLNREKLVAGGRHSDSFYRSIAARAVRVRRRSQWRCPARAYARQITPRESALPRSLANPCVLLAILLAASPSSARAEIKIRYPIVDYRQFEFEHNGAVSVDKSNSGLNNSQSYSFEIGYGATRWWAPEIEGE
jgi:Cupredoxin-like domain